MNRKMKIFGGKSADKLLWDIGSRLLSRGESMKLRAPGNSITPFICHRDVVLIKPCRAEELKFGEVILYEDLSDRCQNLATVSNKLESRKTIHRFLGRKRVKGQEILITKGDANSSYDRPILPEQLLGKVIEVQKKRWNIKLETKMGRLLNTFFAVVSPFSFLACPPLRLLKRTIRLHYE
ncbi:hypothetical protein ES703_50714 [subsurface metagenome]